MSKILIIEDDPYVLRFYENLFRLANPDYQILTAQSGEVGFATAKNELPDLVLLDIVMPGKNGLSVLQDLKADPVTQHISVVMLTNIDDTETVKKCTELGASGFLVKSSTPPQELVQKVDAYLATYKL